MTLPFVKCVHVHHSGWGIQKRQHTKVIFGHWSEAVRHTMLDAGPGGVVLSCMLDAEELGSCSSAAAERMHLHQANLL